MAVPYTFGSATTSIPLSQLDSNFATTITLGNTAIQLGNTVTTLNNMTLGNVTISSGTSNIQTNVANATGVLLEANGGTGTTTGYYGFKNRIINGAMVIDQRYAGAATANTINDYTLDRWGMFQSVTGKVIVQQNAGSVTPPTGFPNYLGITSQSAYSIVSSSYYQLLQPIEGFNTADLAWGTASAATVTLSFWVRSSLTGTFGGALVNSAHTRSYPFTYTISSANTWEQKSITIAGDTSGTWVGATNGIGINVNFGLGVGSTLSGTAGAWATGFYISATGATSVVGTNGATFYITGVQLEKGSTATSFDYRPYGTELALCQRYFEKSYDIGTAPATNTTTGFWTMAGSTNQANNMLLPIRWKVEKRAAPTVTGYANDGTSGLFNYGRNGASGTTTATFDSIGTSGCRGIANAGAAWVVAYVEAQYAASAEL